MMKERAVNLKIGKAELSSSYHKREDLRLGAFQS